MPIILLLSRRLAGVSCITYFWHYLKGMEGFFQEKNREIHAETSASLASISTVDHSSTLVRSCVESGAHSGSVASR